MKQGGWIQRRKKGDSGPVIEEDDDVQEEEVLAEEPITQSAPNSSRASLAFCFSPHSGRIVEAVPDSQEPAASQDVIESSFFSHASIPEESADELFARAVSSMYASEPAPSSAPSQTKKRGRKRKSPEREEAASDVNLSDVYKPRSVSSTPVEYKWKSSLVRLPSRDSQPEEVEEEVEDVDANSGDEEEEFVPSTQEREATPNPATTQAANRHRPLPQEGKDDEVEDISDDEDTGFGSALPNFKTPERPQWGHARQPASALKGKKHKEKAIDEESGPDDIHVSEHEDERGADQGRALDEQEDDFAPLSLPTPMFPTPPVLVNVKREEDIEEAEEEMLLEDDRHPHRMTMTGHFRDDGEGVDEPIAEGDEAFGGRDGGDGMVLEDDDIEAEATEDNRGWPRRVVPIIKQEDMDEFSEWNGTVATPLHGESPPQLQKRFRLGRPQPAVPETSPGGRGRFLQMIKTPEKDTQSLGGAALPGVAPRRLVPSGFAMRLSRIVERYVSRMSVALPTLPTLIPTEVQPATPAGISIHVLSLKPQAGLFTATAIVLPPANATLEEATENGWKPEQVSVVFSQMVGKALNLNPEQPQTLHVLAPWHEVTVDGRRVILTGNCVKDHAPDNLEDILCLLASAPPPHPPPPASPPRSSQRLDNAASQGSQTAAGEGSVEELGVASQTHSDGGEEEGDSTKKARLVGLSSFLPVGTEMPAFLGLVQRAYIFAFPPATKSSAAAADGQPKATALEGELDNASLSVMTAAHREPYSATLLIQDADQNVCLLRIPASCVAHWQDIILQGEGRAYHFSKLVVVASCMGPHTIKDQGVTTILASIGADKRGTNVTLLAANSASLALEDSDSAGEDDDDGGGEEQSRAQLRAHYKPPQTHILRNIAPLLYPRGSPAHPAAERRVSIVCRVVAVVSSANRRFWTVRPDGAAATGPPPSGATTTLFVTDPSLPPLPSGPSSSSSSSSPSPAPSYLVRVELPRWLPQDAVWDLVPCDSLLYISNLLLRVEGESENGPALTADDFTCIKKACRPQEGPTTWLGEDDRGSAEASIPHPPSLSLSLLFPTMPVLASQAFPQEVITALEQLHTAIPSLHSFYAPNPHPLPFPSLHKGAVLRLTGKIAGVTTPVEGSADPFYDACAHCRLRAERRESAMGEWWFCSACKRMLSSPVRICSLSLHVTLPTPLVGPQSLVDGRRLRLEVEHEQVKDLVGDNAPLEELDWPTVLDALVNRTVAAECVLQTSLLDTVRGQPASASSVEPVFRLTRVGV